MILNNGPGKAISSTQRKITLIIDVTFTTPDVDVLDIFFIDD